MNCVFFGHRDAPQIVKEKIKDAILNLLNEGYRSFFVGNNGSFDALTQAALQEVGEKNPELKYNIVLSRIDESALNGKQEMTIFPEGGERFLPKYAILKRNDWMLKRASVLVVYLLNSYSNVAKYVKRARKKGIRVINLAKGKI